jgi:RNA polymerase sigma-70 factor (ECF subfamily)
MEIRFMSFSHRADLPDPFGSRSTLDRHVLEVGEGPGVTGRGRGRRRNLFLATASKEGRRLHMVQLERLDAQAVGTALTGLTDADVVRRVLDGEPALFEVLMRRHNQRVFRAIRSVLRDDGESEDAMQQAWLNAYSHLGQYEGTSAFPTWMTRIALNEALGRVGRRQRLVPIDQVPEGEAGMRSTAQDPDGRAADRELGRMMEEAVDELPDMYRGVFMLREIEGMSTADAAFALGTSEEVVKVRLHRARLLLRDRLYERVGSAARGAFPFLGWRCDRMVAKVLGRILGDPPPAA